MADPTGARCLPPLSTLRPDRTAWSRPAIAAASGLVALMLAGCQSSTPGPGSIRVQASERALPVMERVALSASRCWFKSGGNEFRAYRLAPELSSYTGRPRILLVPAGRPEDRPLAVIEAQGDPAYGSGLRPAAGRTAGQPYCRRRAQLDRRIDELRDLTEQDGYRSE